MAELDERLYYTMDANFNATALVDAATGNVVERYLYDPYGRASFRKDDWTPQEVPGEPAGTASAYANEILYGGYRHDRETRLYHVGNRYYHPSLGRFVSRDPSGYTDGMSLYEYAAGGPLSRVDPTGLWRRVWWHDVAFGMQPDYRTVLGGAMDALESAAGASAPARPSSAPASSASVSGQAEEEAGWAWHVCVKVNPAFLMACVAGGLSGGDSVSGRVKRFYHNGAEALKEHMTGMAAMGVKFVVVTARTLHDRPALLARPPMALMAAQQEVFFRPLAHKINKGRLNVEGAYGQGGLVAAYRQCRLEELRLLPVSGSVVKWGEALERTGRSDDKLLWHAGIEALEIYLAAKASAELGPRVGRAIRMRVRPAARVRGATRTNGQLVQDSGRAGISEGIAGRQVTIKPGHGARHLAGTGLRSGTVETAIRAQVQQATQGASATGSFWGRVTVEGQVIQYRAFTLPNGTINVGTYYPVTP